jgi:hypothetical protein
MFRAASCQIETMRQYFEVYPLEADSFEADVRVLIQDSLRAALEQLSSTARGELTAIEAAIKKTTDDDAQDHLVDEHVDVLAQELSQGRFLRNMALVALASRLTHALRKMARTAEHFRPRRKRYGKSSDSEFERLWKEYTDRFLIDFAVNAPRIAFVEPMQKVRNRIVHEGAEANSWNSATVESLQRGEEPILDTSFSEAYSEFVTGEGWDAEVVVSQGQLDSMCDAAVALVRWLAIELDTQDRSDAEAS